MYFMHYHSILSIITLGIQQIFSQYKSDTSLTEFQIFLIAKYKRVLYLWNNKYKWSKSRLPYNIQIDSKRKLFMPWVFRNLATQKVLDSNAKGDVYALVQNGGNYQKWVKSGNTLRNVSTGRMLDSNWKGDAYTLPSNGGNYQAWEIIPTHYNCFNLRNIATGRFLDSNGDGQVYTLQDNGGNYQKWQIIQRDI